MVLVLANSSAYMAKKMSHLCMGLGFQKSSCDVLSLAHCLVLMLTSLGHFLLRFFQSYRALCIPLLCMRCLRHHTALRHVSCHQPSVVIIKPLQGDWICHGAFSSMRAPVQGRPAEQLLCPGMHAPPSSYVPAPALMPPGNGNHTIHRQPLPRHSRLTYALGQQPALNPQPQSKWTYAG